MAKRQLMKLARMAAGLTQLALAEELGVKERTITMIETGRTDPMPSLALRISSTVDARVDKLFPNLGLGSGGDDA